MKESGGEDLMKTKMIVGAIITLFLVGVLTMAFSPLTTAHTEADPFVTDLIAGQTVDAGDVSVWNDGVHLYVKYETAGDWCLSTTNLDVATTLGEIPHTKKGLPIPGQFDYPMPHDPCTTEYTYEIDLNGWGPGTKLYIAAHAVVCEPGGGFVQGVITTVPLWIWTEAFNRGTVTVAIEGENLVVTYETISGWLMLDTHLYLDPTTPPTYPPPYDSFPFKHEGLGGGAGVTTDTYSISLPSLGVGCGDTLYISTHAYLRYNGTGIYRHAWGQLEEPLDMSKWIKYFSVTIPCEYVCKTAWGKGLRFTRTSWAMYFTYTVQGD